jgi:coenzyme F420-0:L-glutamate ligase/coenzyme F420-1:gamma-L-glutamate ligase
VDNRFGVQVAVIIADSMNRPWRLGTIACALGVAGLQVIDDLRGGHDMFGRELKVAMVNRADSLAAAAGLLMGETTERTPVVLIKGFPVDSSDDRAAVIVRPPEDDMFK